MESFSPDWKQIAEDFSRKLFSNRELAKRYGVSESAIRKRAKKDGWARGEVECAPPCAPEDAPVDRRSVGIAEELAAASPAELSKRGRNIILDLMAELEAVGNNVPMLEEMIDAEFSGEKEARRRSQLLRVLSFESRAKTANYLATALAKLNDAAPGKKELAQHAAETAGQGSEWGGDLDVAPARAN